MAISQKGFYEMKRKTPKKERAAHLGQQAATQNNLQTEPYRNCAPESRENLKEQIGLLLWFLCGPISEKQSAAGWQLLEVLYGQYLSAKSGGTQ